MTRIIILIAAALLLTGCSTMTPQQNLATAEAGFTALVGGINAVEVTKPFPPATWALVQGVVTKASTAFDVLDAKVADGTITTNKQLVNAAAWVTVQAALQELATYQQAGVVTNGGTATGPARSRPRPQLVRPGGGRPRVGQSRLYPPANSRYYRSAA